MCVTGGRRTRSCVEGGRAAHLALTLHPGGAVPGVKLDEHGGKHWRRRDMMLEQVGTLDLYTYVCTMHVPYACHTCPHPLPSPPSPHTTSSATSTHPILLCPSPHCHPPPNQPSTLLPPPPTSHLPPPTLHTTPPYTHTIAQTTHKPHAENPIHHPPYATCSVVLWHACARLHRGARAWGRALLRGRHFPPHSELHGMACLA